MSEEASPLLPRMQAPPAPELGLAGTMFAEEAMLELAIDDDATDEDEEHKLWIAQVQGLSWRQKPTTLKLGILLFLYGLALGVLAPLIQVILYKLACQLLTANTRAANGVCDPVQVQQIVTNYEMWNNVCTSVVLMLTVSKVCQLSDIHGRKPLLVVFAAFLFVGFSIIYLAMRYSTGMPAFWLILGNVIALFPGGTWGFAALAKAYITDITPATERISAMAFAMMWVTLGTVLSPILLNMLVVAARKKEHLGPLPPNKHVPGIAADNGSVFNAIGRLDLITVEALLLLFVVVLLVSWTIVGESRSTKLLSKSRAASISLRNELQVREFNAFRHRVAEFLRPLRILGYPEEFKNRHNERCFGRTRATVMILSFCEALATGMLIVTVTLQPQYGIYTFHWDTITLANTQLATSIATIVMLSGVSPLLANYILPYFGAKTRQYLMDSVDAFFVTLSALVLMATTLGESIAPNTMCFVCLLMLQTYFGLLSPGISSTLMKFFPTSKSGELYGGLSLALAAASLMLPVVFSQLFNYGVRHGMPSVPFVVLSLLSGLVAIATFAAKRMVRDCVEDA